MLDRQVQDTGVAIGVGFMWTTYGCPHHNGQASTFSLHYKSSGSVTALPLPTVPKVRLSVISILESLTSYNAGGSCPVMHREPRDCPHCPTVNRSATGRTQVTLGVDLDQNGPSHFFAQVHPGDDSSASPQDGKSTAQRLADRADSSGVDPSFRIEVFGEVYILCAVVYSAHFASQVYLADEKCWVTYSSEWQDCKARYGPAFDAGFEKGNEDMFLYVLESVLKQEDCLILEFVDLLSSDDEHARLPACQVKDKEGQSFGNPQDISKRLLSLFLLSPYSCFGMPFVCCRPPCPTNG